MVFLTNISTLHVLMGQVLGSVKRIDQNVHKDFLKCCMLSLKVLEVRY